MSSKDKFDGWNESRTLGRGNRLFWCRTERELITKRSLDKPIAARFSKEEYQEVIDLVQKNGNRGTPLGASGDRSVSQDSVGALLTQLRGTSSIRPLTAHIAAIAHDEGFVYRGQGKGGCLYPTPEASSREE